MANLLATRVPELRAAAPFDGGPPPLDQVGHIRDEPVPDFADHDERINPALRCRRSPAGVGQAMALFERTLR